MKKIFIVLTVMALGLSCLIAARAQEPPLVIQVNPPNNSANVPVDLGRLVIKFNRDMDRNTWSLVRHNQYPFPPVKEEGNPWQDPRTFVLKIEPLQPDSVYAVVLNSPSKKGFTAADDRTPLPVTTIYFRTAATGGPQSFSPQHPPAVATSADRPDETIPTLAFRRVAEPNEGAFFILAPQGWQVRGGIFRVNPAQAGGPGNAVAAKNDFTLINPEGTVSLRYLPDINYAAGPGLEGLFPTGSNYQGMTVMPLMSAPAFLENAFKHLHPQAAEVQIVDRRQLPHTIQAYQQALAPVNQSLTQVGVPPLGIDAGKLVVDFTEGGVKYREELASAVVDATRAARQWNNSRTYVFRAPRSEFSRWRRAMAIAHNSIQINPKWLEGELKGQQYRSQQVIKVMHEIQRIEAEIVANRQRTNAEIMHENYLMLTGQEDYHNPHTGQVERDTNEYQYRWVTPGGDRIYTNDPNLDPSRYSHQGDWRRSQVRPR